jgi:hypothetical protein
MEDQINGKQSSGLSSNALRAWGMMFLTIGIAGRTIFQNTLLGLESMTNSELLAALDNPETMTYATILLIMKAAESCAIPIFAFLLVEGFQRTSNFKNYFLRVLGLAVLTELPYNFAMSGNLLDFSERNPVFAVAVSLILLYLYERHSEKNMANFFIKLVSTVAAVVWMIMLVIPDGVYLAILSAVLWVFRSNSLKRNMAGLSVSVACSLLSPFYLASPMTFLAIHCYNEEQGGENRLVNYLGYPVILLFFAIISMFI